MSDADLRSIVQCMRIDVEALRKQRLSCLVIDEAQNIKNNKAATTKALKSIKVSPPRLLPLIHVPAPVVSVGIDAEQASHAKGWVLAGHPLRGRSTRLNLHQSFEWLCSRDEAFSRVAC